MLGLTPNAAELEDDIIQVTPHAKKLEDARLIVNRLVAQRRTYDSRMKTQRQAWDIILNRISSEKETAIKKANKDFEESQAKARRDHAAHKADLGEGIESQHLEERIEIRYKIQILESENRHYPEKDKAARDAYHEADIECVEVMAKRKIGLEVKGELKRKREVSPVIAVSSAAGNSPLTEADPEVTEDEVDCIDITPPKKAMQAAPVKKLKAQKGR